MMLNFILNKDCLSGLTELPSGSIDLVFADPPYNLQLAGELTRPNHSVVDGVNNLEEKISSVKLPLSDEERQYIENEYKTLTSQVSQSATTVDNKTTMIVVMPNENQLFTTNDQYEISEVLAANSEGFLEANIITMMMNYS